MRVNKVQLKNIGPHKDLLVEFGSGLIGLTGANGAGKSTLVNSVYAALTNDFSRFNATRSEVINNTCGKEQSFIELEGEHRGQSFVLRRSLQPNKSYFKIGEEPALTKSSDVTDGVQVRLGISKAVIDKYVFVDQWQMFQFLSDTPSDRAKTFQYLCGTESATVIHKACSDFVMNHKNTQIVDNSIELRESMDQTQERIAAYEQSIKSHKSKIVSAEQLAEAEQEIEDFERFRDYKLNRDTTEDFESNIQRHSESLAKSKKELANFQKNYKAFSDAFDACLNDEKYGSFLSGYEHWLDNLKSAYKLRKLLRTRSKGLEGLEPQVTLTEKLKAHKKAIATLENQVWSLNDKIKDLSESTCPTCGAEFDNEDKLKEAEDRLAEKLESLEKYKSSQEELNHLLTPYQQVEHIKSQIRLLGKTLPAGWKKIKVSEFMSFVSTAEKAKDMRDTYAGYVEGQQKVVKSQQELVDLTESDFAEYSALKAKNLTEDKALAAQRLRHDHYLAIDEVRTLEGKISEAKENFQRYSQMLKDLKARVAEKRKIRNLLDVVSSVGDIFHWNKLPKTVSQANLEFLVDDINDNLAMFNNPFYVEADEELTFRVFFPGKAPVKAKQLSGGQKVVLSIAFRSALDRVFGHDVGMMFLDEPTAGLDADNVLYFHDALQQMAKKVQGDRQLVVITHVQELNGVFDQLIEI